MQKGTMMKKTKMLIFFIASGIFTILTACGQTDRVIALQDLEFKEKPAYIEVDNREEDSASEENTICVYVCGQVKKPGVVRVKEKSRAEDALMLAGGFTANADRDYINLAAYVSDGEKLYFPSCEETQAGKVEDDGRININTAPEEELMTLSGVGESRAKDIISYRERNGEFTSIEDIKKISGIKDSLYEKIKDYIKVK